MINACKPERWNSDTSASIQQYNEWFMSTAPKAFQDQRKDSLEHVQQMFSDCGYLSNLTADYLCQHPKDLKVFRMMCSPVLAKDRLAGLSSVRKSLIGSMEEMEEGKTLPSKNKADVAAMLNILEKLRDRYLFQWTVENREPTELELTVAISVLADRLCGSLTDPVIRNAQEKRQLDALSAYLDRKGYMKVSDPDIDAFSMSPGTYSFHKNVSLFKNALNAEAGYVKTPVDVVVMPFVGGGVPVLIECKSAGDATNTNKRRKEEDTKVAQLRATYGDVTLYLFLCGYFDAGYLGYEAANHMDWVWEHRIEDFDEVIPSAARI